jgi:WD40 repeat protein
MATSRKAKLLPAKKPAAKKPAAKKPLDLKGLGSGGAKSALGSVQKRRALLIGINHYKELTSLQYAVRDVKAIKDALEGFRYEDIQILHDDAGPKQKPTYKNVVRELEEFVERAERDDLLLVYFAGHGKMKKDKPWLFLSDSKWNEEKQWYDQVLSVEKLKSLLKQGASERLVLMMDACQTGEVGERDAVDPSERARFIRRAYEEARGIAVLAGSSPGQKAQEITELRHGVFTHYVLDGLKDRSLVDERTRMLTVSRLAAHVTQKLAKWRKQKSIYVQAPHLQMDGGDLALVDHSRKARAELDNRPFPKLRELWRLEGHTKGEEIRHIASSPAGSQFLSVSDDGTARLWNAETGRAVGKPYLHDGMVVWHASISMDGKRFATLSDNGTIRLWSIGTARHKREIGEMEFVNSIAFTPDGRYLAVGSDRSVEFFDLRGDERGEPAEGHIGFVSAIAFLDSHELMATGGSDGIALLWNYTTREVLQIYPRSAREHLFEDSTSPPSSGSAQPPSEEDEGRYESIPSVALSPDGKLLATGGDDGDPDSKTLRTFPRVWSTRTGDLLYSIREHTQAVMVVQFAPKKHVLLTASRDGTARLWQASSGKLLQTLDEPRIPITAGAFSADGTRVILGYADGSIRIFGPE